MKERIEQLRGGVAWAMTGIGPKPVMSPPDEQGNDGGQDNSGNDQGGANASGGSGNENDGNGDGAGDKGGRVGKLGGLFANRTNGNADDGKGGDNGGSDNAEPGADGRPAGLADKFWNAKDKTVNFDALNKAYTDLEKAHGELKRSKTVGGEVPENAADYFSQGVTVPEAADRYAGLTADDPGVKAWADTCKKYGVGKDLAGKLMSEMLVTMNDHAPVPIDPEQEMKALGKGGPALVDGLFVWVDGLERAGELSEDDIGVVETLSRTANGMRFLAKLRNMTGEKPIPVDPGGGAKGMSLDQLNAEYKEAVNKKDYKRQAELDELRTRLNPEGQAPGISANVGYSL